MAKNKHPKMDRLRVSNQKWELYYVAEKFNVGVEDVRLAKKAVGDSRRKIYKYIRDNYPQAAKAEAINAGAAVQDGSNDNMAGDGTDSNQ